jgi:hypothetical protein
MFRPFRRGGRSRSRMLFCPSVDAMEERALLSGFSARVSLPPGLGGLVGPGKTKDLDAAGFRQLMGALRNGAGAEFAALLRRQVKNPATIVAQFIAKTRTMFATPGFAARTPNLIDTYTGPRRDQFNPIAAGAVRLPGGTLSLGAIMRGPIDRPEPVRYVWALDLGRGATKPWAELPGIKADTLVTVARSGGRVRVRVTDLIDGSTRTLSRRVEIAGPTVRLRLNPADDLPTGGDPIAQARFAFWTQSGLKGGGFATVGRAVPERSIPIGVLPRGSQ